MQRAEEDDDDNDDDDVENDDHKDEEIGWPDPIRLYILYLQRYPSCSQVHN